MDKSRVRFLFASSSHPFVQRLQGLSNLKRTTEFKGRSFMLNVLKTVPPVQCFSKFVKPPLIVYPEDKWRKKFTRDVLNSKYRFLITRPVVMYAGYFDSSKDIIEVAVKKQLDLMARTDLQVSSETAYVNVKKWLFDKLERMSQTDLTASVFSEKIVKQSQQSVANLDGSQYSEIATFYQNLLEEEDKEINKKEVPLPIDNITPTSLELEKELSSQVFNPVATDHKSYALKNHLKDTTLKNEIAEIRASN
jgi:hypothetical protein